MPTLPPSTKWRPSATVATWDWLGYTYTSRKLSGPQPASKRQDLPTSQAVAPLWCDWMGIRQRERKLGNRPESQKHWGFSTESLVRLYRKRLLAREQNVGIDGVHSKMWPLVQDVREEWC